MELDLDAFIHSHLSNDEDDDDLLSVPYRTIDEILNDSDSSIASSPDTSPHSPVADQHRASVTSDDTVSVSSSVLPSESALEVSHKASEAPKSAQWDEKLVQLRPGSNSRAKVGEFSDDPFRRISRPLPSLFGGVRSNAKPGAALAAAAAASRSIPTPHAAAIKSRRAVSGGLQKVLDGGELTSTLGDDSEVASGGLGSSNGDFSASGEKLLDNDERFSNYQAALVDVTSSFSVTDGVQGGTDRSGVVFMGNDLESEAEQASEANDLRVSNIVGEELGSPRSLVSNSNAEPQHEPSRYTEDEGNIDGKSTILLSSEVKVGNVVSASADEKVSGMEETSKLVATLPESGKSGRIEVDSKTIESETQALQESSPGSKDDELDHGDEDASSMSDINELVEERIGQLENKRIGRKAEKRSRSSMKPLELAEELEKKQASTGLHWEEGAAAQPMRLEGVKRGSTTLGYFDVEADNIITTTISSQTFRREHGSSQVLAVHANYIAVGMAKGVIFVFPSKYSAQNADIMDSKFLMLGLQGDRSNAAVTSICFNQQGDLLLAGYSDGHVNVWDVLRASAAKVISGEHTAPVVHTLFLGQDSQVTRQFKAITGDSKGLVLLHAFSVVPVPLLNRFSVKTQCLLDGQRTGTVLSASPLLFDDSCGSALPSSQGNGTVSTSSISSMMGGVVGGDAGWKLFNEGSPLIEEGVVIFVTNQTALVVRLSPTLEVYAQLPKPDGVREGSMPYTAWKCTTQSRSSPGETAEVVERVSLLAIAWDRKVQVAKLVKSELKVYGKWSLDSAAIGVAWLDDQMLVVLTMTGQICLFAKDGTGIHQTSFAVDGFGWDDVVSYHTFFINSFGNPEKAYHNCIAVRGASIYVLGSVHLVVSRLLPWKERIEVLRKAGDWMGSLNMAMTIYDGHAHGVVDLPRSLEAVQEAIMPYLVDLLLSYVDEVFSYISVAFCNQLGKMEQMDDPSNRSCVVHSEIKEQYSRVGGVSVEFCVHIKRTDLLFDEIFSKFVAVQQRDTFLELLEPYVLKDMLGSLPPEIMQELVEHYSHKGWLQRVEQCVLHMDISSLDFNQVVRLCREHGLYGALIYLFNKGLDDFRAPLEELLVALRNSQRENASALGYRMLVYLKYCFSGLAFPPGQGTLSPSRLPSLKTELLKFLLEDADARNSRTVSSLSSEKGYLNVYHLLELDIEATLDVLRCAIVDAEIPKAESSLHDRDDASLDVEKNGSSIIGNQNLLLQNIVDALVHILGNDVSQTDGWPSKKDIGHLFEFIAEYVARGKAVVSKGVLSQILEYLTSESDCLPRNSKQSITSKRREKQVLALLVVVSDNHWDTSYVLSLCEKAQFYQVCGLIHTVRHQYVAALDSYMKDLNEPIHAFSFINKILLELTLNEYAAFRSAVIARIPQLINLNREGAFFLVIDQFNNETPDILSELRSHPRSLFLYLKTVIEAHLSGTVNFSYLGDDNVGLKDMSNEVKDYLQRLSDFPKFMRNNPVNVTDDIVELYLELLCQYERESVLKFLETFDSYRVEHCLRLCQQYGVVDATAFLLERVGDVGNALLLTLSSLNEKFTNLDTAIGSLVSKVSLNGSAVAEHFSSALQLVEVNDVENVLQACIILCQRNTPRLNPEESETLWFRLLDSFCEPLIDSYSNVTATQIEKNGLVTESSGKENDEGACIINWKISKLHKGAHILRKLFSRFIKEIVEGMIGFVRLPTIMSKLLSDNGSQEFGDFKLTILGMLGTYGFERRILDTAKSLIEDDTFYTMSLLKKGASHGYAPRSLVCCICNCLLTKSPLSSRIRVFNCGHSTHLQCEVLESSASGGDSSGCPLCMPINKSQRPRSKSVLVENGLSKKFPPRIQPGSGTMVQHPHETDTLEHPYGLQQISRFEILTNLQKDQRVVQIEKMPQLRLTPPAVYHEKVKKGPDLLIGESSKGLDKVEKQSKTRQLRELKVKGSSSLRFPLKSSLFGKERTSRH